MELLTDFNANDLIESYDISELEMNIRIRADNKSFTRLSFHIVLREPFIDDDIEITEDCLVSPSTEAQQEFIDAQINYPLVVNGEKQITVKAQLASTMHGGANLLDSFKCFPDYVLDNEKYLELYIKAILIDDSRNKLEERITVKVKNPWI